MGLSFCPTVRDGCSVLWVTESSCVVDSVFVCVSAGVNMCRNVGLCVCVCSWRCAVLLCRSRVHVDLFHVILTAMSLFHHAALSTLIQIAEDILRAVKSEQPNTLSHLIMNL